MRGKGFILIFHSDEESPPPTLAPPPTTTSTGMEMTTRVKGATKTAQDQVSLTTHANTDHGDGTTGTRPSTEQLHNSQSVLLDISTAKNRSASVQCTIYMLSLVALLGKFIVTDLKL